MRILSALAALGQLGLALGAPIPPALESRDYPSLSYYGYIDQARATANRLPFVNLASQPIDFHDAGNEGAVHAQKARAALMRAEGLSHKTWEVSTFYQAKSELYGVTEHSWNAKSFLSLSPNDASFAEAVDKLPALLDVGGDGYLVDGDRGSQADVFSLIPAVWASGDQGAARGMLGWLRERGMRDGDIYSHRGDAPQLWSDQGYMIPPVLAYMGLVDGDDGLLREALEQWTKTALALKADDGTFRHVPSAWDLNTWSSGTGWMLQGAARVFASVAAAGKTEQFRPQLDEAKALAKRALFAAFGAQTDDGRLPNYTDRDTPPETAGTAGVTAAFYRLLTLEPDFGEQWLFDRAERAYAAVMRQVTDDGVVTGCVDPSGANFNNADTDDSPEGHAFVALMWAARNQWLGLHPDGTLPTPQQKAADKYPV